MRADGIMRRIDRTILDEYEHSREIVKCAILHSRGHTNLDIGRRLGINPPRVTRNIQEAEKSGIIKIEVYPPPEVEVAEKIQEVYGLREAHVFPIGVSEEITNMLGGLAAAYLDRCLDDEGEKIGRVAIGPGRTILVFATALSDVERSGMIVRSTTSATSVETHVASNILIGIPAGKWKCRLRRFDPQAPLREQKDYADILVFGIGKIPDIEGVTALALISATGISRSEMERKLFDLASRGGAGIINYQPIREGGHPLSWRIKEYRQIFESTVLELSTIREMAQDKKKRVICIAGGMDKVEAIRAGLRGGYFNVLITDHETAAELLERQNE